VHGQRGATLKAVDGAPAGEGAGGVWEGCWLVRFARGVRWGGGTVHREEVTEGSSESLGAF
jgi:hypothetical protein